VTTVLFVDDEPMMLRTLERASKQAPFCAHTAASVDEAVALMRTQAFDCVVTDFRMPRSNGIDVLEAARTLRPRAARVIMTGQADPQALEHARKAGVVQYVVEKPFTLAQLKNTIACALAVMHTSAA
jgi:DNA-binding NtrC family response regulator